MVTRSGVGATRVTLSDRGTKDSKVEDTGASTMDVNPCVFPIRPHSTSLAARELRENQTSAPVDKCNATIISMRMRMISSSPCLTRPGARGSLMHAARRDAMPSRRPTSRSASSPPSDDMLAPSKRATIVLPQTGDRPGKQGLDSTPTGMRFRDPLGLASTPKTYIISAACPMPVSPHDFSGLVQRGSQKLMARSCRIRNDVIQNWKINPCKMPKRLS
jgi:hypothetical protein